MMSWWRLCWASALRDGRRRWKEPATLAVWFSMPFFIWLLQEMVFPGLMVSEVLPEPEANLPGQIISINQTLPSAPRLQVRGLEASWVLFPGSLLLGLLFIAQNLSDDLWLELERKTWARTRSSPHSRMALWSAKLVAGSFFLGGVALLALAAAFYGYRIPWGRFPVAGLWVVVAGAVFLSLLQCLQLCASGRRGGSLLTGITVLAMAMLGGSFLPFAALPLWWRRIGLWSPSGFVHHGLQRSLSGDWTATSAVGSALVAAILIAACAWWGNRRMELQLERVS
ncbi:MAG: ABC transporter permease [Planctomycetota bacterium]|nr:MAG: ABC transporter permease [Planctomycetota bacterium]